MSPIERERERERERGRGILAWVSGMETVREREREGLDGEQSRVRSPQFMNHSGSFVPFCMSDQWLDFES